MLTMSNLTITDFDNPQVAFTANLSPFGHYYSKYIRSIYRNLLIKPYRPNSKSEPELGNAR